MELLDKYATKLSTMIVITAVAFFASGIWLLEVAEIGMKTSDILRTKSAPNVSYNYSSNLGGNLIVGQDGGALSDAKMINVNFFGAKGDGKTNDTAAILAAISDAFETGATVFIPAGTYMVDAVESIKLKNGITLQMTPETILRVIPNNAEKYAVLAVDGLENVRIISGVLLGDRGQHLGRSGEWGMGIRITGSKNILVQETVCNEFWGDGFYIGEGDIGRPSENIRIIGIKADQNRRQGLSLISGRNIEIAGAKITNTHGTAPSAGIDIEPSDIRNVLDNIVIADLYTAGNQGAGLLVNTGALSGTRSAVSIKVINHQDDGSDRGMQISSKGIVPGSLIIEDADWRYSKRNAIAIQSHDHRSFHIEILRANITNVNQGTRGAAIDIYSFKDDPLNENGGIGNITIERPVITDTSVIPRTVAAFHIWDLPGHQVRNLSIIDPVLKGNLTYLPVQTETKAFIRYTQE